MPTVRYQPLGPLLSGEGSRAFLGLALSESEALPIALVWVPEQVAGDTELLEKLQRETERAATLLHPNIIRVHGLTATDEGPARVVEYADGESLRRVLQVAKRLTPPLAALVVAEAAAGVHHAHVVGDNAGGPLVHGDLRPETLMLTYTGVTKVSGYGALTVAPKEMHGKRVMGRRLYCAPEQLLGGRDAVTRQTDVYLLGLVLFELLTGEVPFKDETDFNKAVLEKDLLLQSDAIPAKLRPIIARATAKKGSDRYPTALALQEALEEVMRPFPPAEKLATFLDHAFLADSARAARQSEISAGIAEYGPKRKASPAPAPVAAVAAVAAAAAPTGAAPTEAPSAAVASPSARRSVLPIFLAGLGLGALLLVGVGAWVKSPREVAPTPGAQASPSAAPAAEPSAEPSAPAAAAVEAPKPAPAPEPTWLDLLVTPPVEVALDGKPAGRTPLKIRATPGKHRLTLTNKALGIQVTRTVTVDRLGTTREDFSIGKGSVSVTGPDGAKVFLDGKLSGTLPLSSDLPLYEGTHHILVDMGRGRWQQTFNVGQDERMDFEVGLEERELATP